RTRSGLAAALAGLDGDMCLPAGERVALHALEGDRAGQRRGDGLAVEQQGGVLVELVVLLVVVVLVTTHGHADHGALLVQQQRRVTAAATGSWLLCARLVPCRYGVSDSWRTGSN